MIFSIPVCDIDCIVFFLQLEPSLGILLTLLSLCKFYYFNHLQVVWPIYYVKTIVKLIAFLCISNSKCTRAQLWNSQTGFKLKKKHYRTVKNKYSYCFETNVLLVGITGKPGLHIIAVSTITNMFPLCPKQF